jgi:hypothetical protein
VVLSGADKAEACLSGVTRDKSAYDFPVCGVESAVWLVDQEAATLLQGKGQEVQIINHV